MGQEAPNVHHMRELAALLRRFASETQDMEYVRKLMRAAAEIDAAANARNASAQNRQSHPGIVHIDISV